MYAIVTSVRVAVVTSVKVAGTCSFTTCVLTIQIYYTLSAMTVPKLTIVHAYWNSYLNPTFHSLN